MAQQSVIKDQIIEHNKWYLFPDSLGQNDDGKFLGFVTKDDITLCRGAFPVGQNVIFTPSRTPTVRPGSTLIGTAVVSPYAVKRAWNFERRDGIQIDMKTYGTGVYFRVEGVMDDYNLLETGFTADLEFCYGVISQSSSSLSQVMYCNGIEEWRKWTGIYATMQSYDNTAHTITFSETLSSPAFLIGNIINQENATASWAPITNGSFRITINGTPYNVDGINFTGVTTMAQVAATIQTALRGATGGLETVEFLSSNQFKITTVDGSSSAITVATTSTGTVGTDISGAGASLYTGLSTGVVTDRSLPVFPTSGNISFNGIQYAYTGVLGNNLTGLSDLGNLTAVSGDIIVQAPSVVSGSSILKSSVCTVHDGRIHARNEAKKSVALYSKLDNPTNWTTGSNDGDGGAKEIEQGGPIVAFAGDEKQVYIFKNRLIKTLDFIASGTRIDVPQYGTPKPSNDKSTTIGAQGQKSTFAGPNGVFFVTTDNQLIYLYRQDFKDWPQQMDIADPIRPTFSIGVHDEAAGIVYNSKVYYAYKQDSHSSYNDTVIVYDLIRNIWSAPFVGWNVSDWTVIGGKLRWHSSNSPDTYELYDDQFDGDYPFTTIIRTWNETFGTPNLQKKVGYAMIEIYLQENSQVTATVLYDENGFNGQEEFILRGSDIQYRLGTANYNPFGANPFGEERFGSNDNISGMNKYRFMLELKGNIEFYNLALQLSSNTENCNYELVRFGYYITQIIKLSDVNYMVTPNGTTDNLNIN